MPTSSNSLVIARVPGSANAMKKRIKASLIAASIAALPFGADAAGLGRLNVLSALGQPLRAEVELTASAQELQSLSARVPSPEAFKQANVAFSPTIADLRLSVEQRGGRSVVRITSNRPVNEPFVDMLIELNWTGGQMRREYTFLLDPVDVLPARPVVAATVPVARPVASAPVESKKLPATSSPGAAGGDSYLVKSGDTLRKIAEQTRPDGVSLDQMVVALFRKNRDAFIADNINRLQAGKILNVPDGQSAKAIPQSEARKEIVAHSADFDTYRKSLAGAVAASPAEPSPSVGGQESAGKITPKVAEAAAGGTPRDQVKVSTGDAGKGGDGSASARLQALEEDIVARDKALQEANARLAELERNIQELQRLVELKNQGMAQAQQAAQGGTGTAAPLPAAAPAPAPAVEATPAAASEPKPLPKPVAPPPAAEPPGFLASLFDDPLTLAGGGGILALLLGYLGLRMRKRGPASLPEEPVELPAAPPPPTAPSVAPSVMGAVGGQSVDTNNVSVLQTDFGQGGLAAIDADEGVDPVAEADVYMAYGRDAQAEEILIDALKVDPTRGAVFVKLLEIYAQRKSLKQFESLATDFYGMTGGHGPDWEKAAAIGRKLDPANPLFAENSVSAESAGTDLPKMAAATAVSQVAVADLDEVPPETSSIKDTWALPGDLQQFVGAGDVDVDLSASLPVVPGQSAGDEEAHSLEFNLDLGAPADAKDGAQAVASSDVPDEVGGLDFNLDVGPDTLPGEESAPVRGSDQAEDPAMISTMVDTDMFRLDLDAPDEPAKPVELEFELPSESKPAASMPDMAATSLAVDAASGGASADDPEATKVQSNLLEFDFDLGDAAPEPKSAPAIDLSGIDLNLDESIGVTTDLQDSIGGEAADDTGSEEIETKLELARAYEDMGDREGARELLEEVLKEGTTGQQNAARTLLAKIA